MNFFPTYKFPHKRIRSLACSKTSQARFFLLLDKTKTNGALCCHCRAKKKNLSLPTIVPKTISDNTKHFTLYSLVFFSEDAKGNLASSALHSFRKNQFIRYCADLIHCSVQHISNCSFPCEGFEIK